MDKGNITKHYTNGEITVVWQSAKCIHAGQCVKHLAKVFQPKSSPWIQIDNASSAEIAEAVHHCPSGALTLLNETKS
jgi:uncharacterized Fe-S cluster protein YjdI